MVIIFIRKKWLIFFVLIILLVISACSNSENKVDDSKKTEEDTNNESKKNDETKDSGPTNLSDAVEDQEVWYSVSLRDSDDNTDLKNVEFKKTDDDEIGKDFTISDVFVFKNNEISRLQAVNKDEFTLSSIDDMSDDDVVDYLLEEFEEANEGTLYLNKPYLWELITDAIGNTEAMKPHVKDTNDTYFSHIVFKDPLGFSVNILNRSYEGYTESGIENIYALTRTDNNENSNEIKLDEPDTDIKKITID